jgi:creatinine amidohydrolase
MTVLARLTWPAAEEALTRARLALLPVGSLEQHGPHLALDTDLAVADALAGRLEKDLGDAALRCPAVHYGLSEHHLGFPGTITLRPDTLAALVLDVVESLAHWGVRRVLVVNGHGGNIDALRLVSRRARRDHGSLVAALMWSQLAADEIATRVTSRTYGHACEVETSVAMVLAPDRVFRDRITGPAGRRSMDPLTDPPRALVDQAVWMDEWTSDGALGDPRLASDELGEAVVGVAHRRAVEFARRFAAASLPNAGPRRHDVGGRSRGTEVGRDE